MSGYFCWVVFSFLIRSYPFSTGNTTCLDPAVLFILLLGLKATQANAASSLKDIDCRVESMTGIVFTNLPASVNRVIKYDPESGRIFLAVRILSDTLDADVSSISLMNGMFCKIFLKGKPAKDEVKVPASLLNPDNTICIVRENRLKTRDIVTVMEKKINSILQGLFLQWTASLPLNLSIPLKT